MADHELKVCGNLLRQFVAVDATDVVLFPAFDGPHGQISEFARKSAIVVAADRN